MKENDFECFARTGVNTPVMAMKTDNRPLYGLKAFSTTIATDINDLPATSPHGSYSEHDTRNPGFATDPNATRGTPTAHHDTCCNSHATDWIISAASVGIV